MKTELAIEKFKELIGLSGEDEKGIESYKPEICKLRSYQAKFNSSLSDSTVIIAEWENGEGFDFQFIDKSGETKNLELHIDELELMLMLLYKIDYLKAK